MGLLLTAAVAQGQRTESMPTGLGLGFGLGHEIATLSEESFCMVSPAIASPATGLTHLVVVEQALDDPLVHYLPLTFSTPLTEKVWPTPIVLSSSRVAIPGPGGDNRYNTADDELIVYSGLDQPTTASQQSYPLPGGAPLLETRIIVVNDTEFAWFDPGADGMWKTGDELLKVLRNIGPNMTALFDPRASGMDGHVFELDNGMVAGRSAGPDLISSSGDEQFITIENDADRHQASIRVAPSGLFMHMPVIGAQWPQAVGSRYATPNAGADGRLGTSDDLLHVREFYTQTSIKDDRPLPQGFLHGIFGPGAIGSESDGTIVMAGAGMDLNPGTTDDLVGFIPQLGSAQVFSPGFALTNPSLGHIHPEVVVLEGDVALVRHYGSSPGSNLGAGVLAFRRNANTGARVMVNHSFGEGVREILPMGRAACAFVLESGAVRVAKRLDTASPVIQVVGTQLHEFASKPVALSPSLIVGMKQGPDGLGYHDDVIQFWRGRASWEYGEATANDQGFNMRLRSDGAIPIVAGPSFFVMLEGAPPSQSGYCLLSLERTSLMVSPDAELLVAVETMFPPYYWQTLADGTTWFPIIPPTDPLYEGARLHMQFIVFNPANARNYELSNGLTLQF